MPEICPRSHLGRPRGHVVELLVEDLLAAFFLLTNERTNELKLLVEDDVAAFFFWSP